MWEWYTTKPFLNEVRFIGSVPTPWPSWSIAASTPTLAAAESRAAVRTFLSALQEYVVRFDSAEARVSDNIDFIEQEFGYERADVEAWLGTVGYESELEGMDEAMIVSTLGALEKAGVVVQPAGGWAVKGEILASLD